MEFNGTVEVNATLSDNASVVRGRETQPDCLLIKELELN